MSLFILSATANGPERAYRVAKGLGNESNGKTWSGNNILHQDEACVNILYMLMGYPAGSAAYVVLQSREDAAPVASWKRSLRLPFGTRLTAAWPCVGRGAGKKGVPLTRTSIRIAICVLNGVQVATSAAFLVVGIRVWRSVTLPANYLSIE